MGGENANFMSGYMSALENMNKEAVEFVRGIPVVKVFQQTVYSFKNFRAAIEEYKKYASGYAICCRIPLTGFNVTLNGTFILLIPVAMMIFAGTSGQSDTQKFVFLIFLFYSSVYTNLYNYDESYHVCKRTVDGGKKRCK